MSAYDKLGRPCKDLYFMNLCFEVNRRSPDPSSKCGCVIVDSRGGILSTGYNGPVRNSNDAEIPTERPQKYYFYEHGERNGIFNAAALGIPLEGSTFYVTGFPCYDCLRGIIQVGAHRLIWGPLGTKMQEGDYLKWYKILLEDQSIGIERFKYDDELFEMNSFAKKCCEGKPKFEIDF